MTDTISFDKEGKNQAKKATFMGAMSGIDFNKLTFLQTNSVLGLGPVRKNKNDEKHFVDELKRSGTIDSTIYGIYLSPDEDKKSSITFGGYDEAIQSESYSQYGGYSSITYLKINNDRKW